MALLITYFLLAVVISFICSVLEAVLLSISTSYVAMMRTERPQLAQRLVRLRDKIDQPLAAILTLNTIAHTVGASGVGAQVAALYGSHYLAIASAVLTFLILVFSEILPKTIGALYWRPLAPVVAVILPVMIKLLYPFVLLSDLITKRLGQGSNELADLRAEIAALAELGHHHGELEQSEATMLRNMLELEHLRVDRIMTPRSVLFSLPAALTIEQYANEYLDKPFSRIPLYQEHKEALLGFVHKQDLLQASFRLSPDTPLRELMRPLPALPSGLNVRRAYQYLLSARVMIAMVVDEYGEVLGLLTLEDIVETLLGQEIVDETDKTTDMQRLARFKWLRRLKRSKQRFSDDESSGREDK